MHKAITRFPPGTFVNPGSIYFLRVTKVARLKTSYCLMHLERGYNDERKYNDVTHYIIFL